MSSFPAFHFPTSYPPREEGSELPDAFGCLHAFDVQSGAAGEAATGSDVCFQYDIGNGEGTGLAPEGPCLPFLPPNEGSSVFEATYEDYVRRAGMTKATVVNVQQQVEECYNHVPEAFAGPLCDILDEHELRTIASYNDLTYQRKRELKKVQAGVFDGVTSAGIQQPLLHKYLTEELLDQAEKMYHNASFYGGCISYEPFSQGTSERHGSGGLLFFPSGLAMDKVSAHVLESVSVEGDVPGLRPTSLLHQLEAAGCVRQIDTQRALHGNSILSGIRTDYRCYVLKTRMKDDAAESSLLHDLCSQCRISSLSLSPHITGEFVFSTEYGQTLLVNKNSKVCASTPDVSSTAKTDPAFSHFTPHPRIIFAHTKDQAYQLDFRIAGDNSSSRNPLFTLPSSCLPNYQYFCVARQHPSNHFYHALATQHYLILVDERFPGHTVLQWSHLLSSPPNYLSIIPSVSSSFSSSDNDLFFATSHSSRETHCFQCSSLTGETPHAAKAPWKIQHNDAWLDLMSTVPNKGEALVRGRLARPLIGMCATKGRLDEDTSLEVFQLTDAGDVFHQVLRVMDPEEATSGPTEMGGLDRRQERRCQEYVEGVLRVEGGCLDAANTMPMTPVMSRGIRKAMVKSAIHLRECSICHRGNNDKAGTQSSKYLRGEVPCPSCGLLRKYSAALMKDPTTNILTSKFREKKSEKWLLLDEVVKKQKVKDQLGRRLLTSWGREHSHHVEEPTASSEKPVKKPKKQPTTPAHDVSGFISQTPVEFREDGFAGIEEAKRLLTPSRLRVSLTRLTSPSQGPKPAKDEESTRAISEQGASDSPGGTPQGRGTDMTSKMGPSSRIHLQDATRAVSQRDTNDNPGVTPHGRGTDVTSRMGPNSRSYLQDVLSPYAQSDGETDEREETPLPRFNITDSPLLPLPNDDEFPSAMLTQRSPIFRRTSPAKSLIPPIRFLPMGPKTPKRKVHSLGF